MSLCVLNAAALVNNASRCIEEEFDHYHRIEAGAKRLLPWNCRFTLRAHCRPSARPFSQARFGSSVLDIGYSTFYTTIVYKNSHLNFLFFTTGVDFIATNELTIPGFSLHTNNDFAIMSK
jgi:hypothetical protein